MSIAAAPDLVLERIRRELSTTPGRLRAALVGIVALALLLGVVAYAAYDGLRDAVQTVGRDTVPSIVAAQRIRATLADANGKVVDAFLAGDRDDGPFWSAYRRDMADVEDALVTAAQNITYGDNERQPILAVMTNLAAYERLIGQARSKRPDAYRTDVVAADQLMRAKILPATVALDAANFGPLTQTFEAHRSARTSAAVPSFVIGAALLAALAATQLFLFRRMRRLINPGLAAATLVLVVFAGYAAVVFGRAEEALRSAKADAFDSIHALSQARAVAYDAHADESLLLLDHGTGLAQVARSNDFRTKAELLAAGDPDRDLAGARTGQRFKGYLGDELANITYSGEQAAAMAALETWAAYLKINASVRSIEGIGRTQDALALAVGTKAGQGGWAFDRFDKALGEVLAINEHEFPIAVDRAFGLLAAFPYVLWAAMIIIAGAAFAGLKPRLDEYRLG